MIQDMTDNPLTAAERLTQKLNRFVAEFGSGDLLFNVDPGDLRAVLERLGRIEVVAEEIHAIAGGCVECAGQDIPWLCPECETRKDEAHARLLKLAEHQ